LSKDRNQEDINMQSDHSNPIVFDPDASDVEDDQNVILSKGKHQSL